MSAYVLGLEDRPDTSPRIWPRPRPFKPLIPEQRALGVLLEQASELTAGALSLEWTGQPAAAGFPGWPVRAMNLVLHEHD